MRIEKRKLANMFHDALVPLAERQKINMKKVVWGTGWVAAKYVGTLKNDDISFFIDSDEKKRGTVFLGRNVRLPDEIECWEELNIYIQHNFYEEIAVLLRTKGLVEGKHFREYEEPRLIAVENIEDDYAEVFNCIEKKKDKLIGRNWYWGATIFTNKVYKDYIEVLQNTLGQGFLTISEAVYISQQESEKRWEMPIIVLPKIFGADYFRITVEKQDGCNYQVILANEYPELMETAKEYRGVHIQLNEDEEYLYTYKQAVFIEKMLKVLKPNRVFIMCSFLVVHRILAKLCRKHNIPVIYTHRGALPRTWSIEVGGEMGESLPAVYAKEFLELPIEEKDVSNAKEVWEFLNTSKINRKIQPKTNWLGKIADKIKKGRPTIFYAGQNDIQSGLAYYGENAKKYHSPIFSSSIDAIPYLAKLAKENNWNLLYKPHPMYMPTKEQIESFPDNVLYVDAADINDIIDYADLTITILSSTAYVALIREKPVLMLGYNQLKGKGCTYEAFSKDVIECTMKQALEEGFTDSQKEAFTKHIAQLLKYYLYEDIDDGTMVFGRTIPKDFKGFYELAELLGAEGV